MVLAPPRGAAETAELPPDRVEPGAVPVFAFNTDQGLGLGLIGNLASFEPGYSPYRWRLRGTFVAFKRLTPSEVPWPLVAVAEAVDLPGLAGGDVRAELSLYYLQHNNCAWFGPGDASTVDPERPEAWYWYQRKRPGARARVTVALPRTAELFAAGGASWTEVVLDPDSKLAEDAAGASGEEVQDMLVGLRPHLLPELTLGLSRDTRDDEFWPTAGGWHEVSLRAGAVVPEQADFGGINLTLRGYLPMLQGGLVIAGRFIADSIVGDPPFYELARFGGSHPGYGPGGESVGRGFGLRRFNGKVKLLGTVELRTVILNFHLTHQRAQFGPAAFVDLARIWSDWTPSPVLDGGGLGLLPSAGGGLRVRWGESFVIRVDAGFSREGHGIYLGAGHPF